MHSKAITFVVERADAKCKRSYVSDTLSRQFSGGHPETDVCGQ